MLKQIWVRFLDILFPPQCLGCEALVSSYGTLCQPCWQQVQFITPPFCHACGLPFEYSLGEQALCGECILRLPVFSQARAAIRYDNHSSALITRLKYADQTQLASVYGPWLARAGHEIIHGCDLIVPVPLHYWRFVKRRYNQSALLAYALKKQSGLSVIPDALIRTRHTPPQTGLSRRERLDNVKGAFRVNSRKRKHLRGKHILLIDDVMTTNATISYCSKALIDGGAQSVRVLTLARAMA